MSRAAGLSAPVGQGHFDPNDFEFDRQLHDMVAFGGELDILILINYGTTTVFCFCSRCKDCTCTRHDRPYVDLPMAGAVVAPATHVYETISASYACVVDHGTHQYTRPWCSQGPLHPARERKRLLRRHHQA